MLVEHSVDENAYKVAIHIQPFFSSENRRREQHEVTQYEAKSGSCDEVFAKELINEYTFRRMN